MYNLRSALVAVIAMLVVIMMMASHVSTLDLAGGMFGNTDNVDQLKSCLTFYFLLYVCMYLCIYVYMYVCMQVGRYSMCVFMYDVHMYGVWNLDYCHFSAICRQDSD